MLNMKTLIALIVSDENIQRWFNETPLEGNRVESLWTRLIGKEEADPAPEIIQAQTLTNFQEMILFVLDQLTKTDQNVLFFYKGDFIRDVWMRIQPWVDMRSERPVKLTLSFELDPTTVSPLEDQDRAYAYVEGILSLLTQVPVFNLKIYQKEADQDLLPFAYQDLFCGVARREDDQNRSIYFSRNPALIQYAFHDLKNHFSDRPTLMRAYPEYMEFLDILDTLGDSDDQSQAYVYMPFVYLYLGSLNLRQAMYEDGYIDKIEYQNWGCFHRFMDKARVRKARFILHRQPMWDAFKRGLVKTQGGFIPLGVYHKTFIEETKHYREPATRLDAIAIDALTGKHPMPSVLIYADKTRTFMIRTSTYRGFDPSRIANIITDKSLAFAFYAYLDTIYCKNQ